MQKSQVQTLISLIVLADFHLKMVSTKHATSLTDAASYKLESEVTALHLKELTSFLIVLGDVTELFGSAP